MMQTPGPRPSSAMTFATSLMAPTMASSGAGPLLPWFPRW